MNTRFGTWRYWAVWSVLLVAVLWPARESRLLSGVPLNALAFCVVAALMAATAFGGRRTSSGLVAVAVGLLVVRAGAAQLAIPKGWATTYYANTEFQDPAERSTEFRDSRWTRIDGRLDFVANTFPLHFLNELRFNFTPERRAPGFSAVSRGYFDRDKEGQVTVEVVSPNPTTVLINGREVAGVGTTRWSGSAPVLAAVNVVEIRYRNPANAARALKVSVTDDRGADLQPELRAFRASARRERTAQAAGAALLFADAAIILCAVWLVAPLWLGAATSGDSSRRALSIVAIGGVLAAVLLFRSWDPPHLQPLILIQSGNDGLAYEDHARRAILDGIWLNSGTLRGQPLIYTVGYHYSMSVAHLLFGESLASVYFFHQLLIWAAIALSVLVARRIGGTSAALLTLLVGVYLKVNVFWPQWYVFRENFVVAMNALLVYFLLRSKFEKAWQSAALGMVAGLNCLTDPINLAVLPIVAFFVWRGAAPALRAKMIGAFALGAVVLISFVPMRNLLATGVPTLLPNEGAPTLWWGNKPPAGLPNHTTGDDYFQVLLNYARSEPRHLAGNLVGKAVYALGFYGVRWSGFPYMPQFSLVNLLGWLLAVVAVPYALRAEPRIVVLYAMAAARFGSEVVFIAEHNVDRYEVALLMLLLPVIGYAIVRVWVFSRLLVLVLAVGMLGRDYMLVLPSLGNVAFAQRVAIADQSYRALRAEFVHDLGSQRPAWSSFADIGRWTPVDGAVTIPGSHEGGAVFQMMHANLAAGIQSPILDVPAALVKDVVVEASFFGWPHTARLWVEYVSPDLRPQAFYFPVDNTGRTARHLIPVHRSDLWNGIVRRISIYYEGDSVILKSATLVAYPDAVPSP